MGVFRIVMKMFELIISCFYDFFFSVFFFFADFILKLMLMAENSLIMSYEILVEIVKEKGICFERISAGT